MQGMYCQVQVEVSELEMALGHIPTLTPRPKLLQKSSLYQ